MIIQKIKKRSPNVGCSDCKITCWDAKKKGLKLFRIQGGRIYSEGRKKTTLCEKCIFRFYKELGIKLKKEMIT